MQSSQKQLMPTSAPFVHVTDKEAKAQPNEVTLA